ncbi:sugar transferase [Methylophilus sp. Leaf414]|uniref:sugar transferase n=1 Tax=Methylophilus sp. Leaf414 TaxID=1736371 RepID=UPI0006F9162C|nr:sugar transferase [Methylophilus sp. Leaf414]KQT34335.1 capsular biosynthesis protein [Methylophilus sp. Leaf414]
MLKRLLDIVLTLGGIIVLLPFIAITYLLVKLSSAGPALYWSQRVGRENQLFLMPKFRSMRIGTPQIATHLMNQQADPDVFLTPVGSFIRKTSLDELPQLWSVLKGDMSIVGPRPALFNQDDLISLRTENQVHTLKPGITGWAQINGRDEIPIPAKVTLDAYYLSHQSLWLDLKIIIMTIVKVLRRDNITH